MIAFLAEAACQPDPFGWPEAVATAAGCLAAAVAAWAMFRYL